MTNTTGNRQEAADDRQKGEANDKRVKQLIKNIDFVERTIIGLKSRIAYLESEQEVKHDETIKT